MGTRLQRHAWPWTLSDAQSDVQHSADVGQIFHRRRTRPSGRAADTVQTLFGLPTQSLNVTRERNAWHDIGFQDGDAVTVREFELLPAFNLIGRRPSVSIRDCLDFRLGNGRKFRRPGRNTPPGDCKFLAVQHLRQDHDADFGALVRIAIDSAEDVVARTGLSFQFR